MQTFHELFETFDAQIALKRRVHGERYLYGTQQDTV